MPSIVSAPRTTGFQRVVLRVATKRAVTTKLVDIGLAMLKDEYLATKAKPAEPCVMPKVIDAAFGPNGYALGMMNRAMVLSRFGIFNA